MTDRSTEPAKSEPQHEEIHEHGAKAATFRLLVIIAAVVAACVFTGYFNAFLVIVAVIAMVMIHEFGHFLTAKWSGMKVTEYFLGFGPRLWSFRHGETEYGIKAIPAGGYVKIIGMSNLEAVASGDEARTYRQQPYWQRIMVASAGSIMHFVMAFLILVILFAGLGLVPKSKIQSTSMLQNGPSPAMAAGLRAGDTIVSIDGKKINNWVDVQNYVIDRPGQQITLGVKRGGQTLSLPTTLTDRSLAKTASGTPLVGSGGFLGATPVDEYARTGFVSAITTSGREMWSGFGQVLTAIKNRFSPAGLSSIVHQVADARKNGEERKAAEAAGQPAPVTSTSSDQARLVSPIGLGNFANQAANAGIRPVLLFLFSVNLFVGVFNLIPLLPFDGGHIAIATYEKLRSLIRRRRYYVDFTKVAPLSYAVLAVLAFTSLSALWLDIWYPAQDVFG